MSGKLIYEAKNGASVVVCGDIRDLCLKLRTLRRPAQLFVNGREDAIGGCEKIDYADDKRIKWNYFYETQYSYEGVQS